MLGVARAHTARSSSYTESGAKSYRALGQFPRQFFAASAPFGPFPEMYSGSFASRHLNTREVAPVFRTRV